MRRLAARAGATMPQLGEAVCAVNWQLYWCGTWPGDRFEHVVVPPHVELCLAQAASRGLLGSAGIAGFCHGVVAGSCEGYSPAPEWLMDGRAPGLSRGAVQAVLAACLP